MTDALPAAASTVRPVTRKRRAIARAMLQSLQTSAQLTSVVELDAEALIQARRSAAEQGEAPPSALAMIAWVTARVLARHPMLNARIDEDLTSVELFTDVHLGIAIDAPGGLVVGKVPSAHLRSAPDIASEIQRLASAARSGRLRLEDFQGSTFTISNTGSRGSLLDTPIVNLPEAAILGVGLVQPRPVVYEGQLAIRHMAYLCLSYDHRLIDGADAARFLVDVTRTCEGTDWAAVADGTA